MFKVHNYFSHFFNLFVVVLMASNSLQAVTVSTPVFTQTSYSRYAKAEATFTIGATYSNVYDPSVVAVDAEITKPSGGTVNFPCFYYVPCSFAAESASFWQATENTAAATWMLRFAPTEEGTYSIRIKVTESGSTISYSLPQTFTTTPSSNKGFIRLDNANRQFMRFDNGKPYYPIGTNVAWNDQRLTQYYSDFFSNIPSGGMTWTRYWLTDFARQALEWKSNHWSGWYNGLGKYSQKAAALLDNVLATCAAKDAYMQLVLQHHGQFSTAVNAQWADNPYNSANGGLFSSAANFFNSTAAKTQTKHQYRYIVARWGYSTNIMAWEFFNEVNYTDGNHADIDAWHDEMSQYLKGLDIHNHLTTTSTHEANSLLVSMDNNASLDQLQFHYYGTNLETSVLSAAQTLDGLVTKPLLSGEFGYSNSNYLNDNTGDHLRKTLWVNMFNRIPTTYWYWSEYIIPKNLYGVFTPLSNFMSSVDVVGETNAAGGALTFQNNPNSSSTLTLNTQSSGFSAGNTPDPWTGTIDAAGNCTNLSGLGRYLHGSVQGFNREVSFTANFTATGTAAINLRGSSGWGNNVLEIYLDGALQNSYNIANNASGVYTLSNIPTGNHTVKFRSAGQDWLEVASYAFTKVAAGTGDCLAFGYVGTQKAYGFVYDKSYGEWSASANNTAGASLRLQLTAGNYQTEFWNPQTGATTNGGLVATNGSGILILNLPTFNKDVAFKVSYASPVPVELLSFSGNTEGSKNRLIWQTATENQLRDFVIERSADGKSNWENIGTTAAKGQSTTKQSYFLDDETPLPISYYRLIANDVDGKTTVSKVIVLQRNSIATVKVKIFPTIAQQQFVAELENAQNIHRFQIVDITGRIWRDEKTQFTVHRTPLEGEGGVQKVFDITDLPNGAYFLVTFTKQGRITARFFKN
jgi:hypothetical protein